MNFCSPISEGIVLQLNSETRRHLENMQGFIRSRREMEEIAMNALPKNYIQQYSSFSKADKTRQREIPLKEGNSWIKDAQSHYLSKAKFRAPTLGDLQFQAEKVLPQFTNILTAIANKNELDKSRVGICKVKRKTLNKHNYQTKLIIAPLKSVERCNEKIKYEYKGDVSQLVDIVRASFIVNSEENLIRIAKKLSKLKVVRLKNRFKEPSWTGYRDALYNIEVNGFICEVQLHLEIFAKHLQKNLKYYYIFRKLFTQDRNLSTKRLNILEEHIDPGADVLLILQDMLDVEAITLYHMAKLAEDMGDFYLEDLIWQHLCNLYPDNLRFKNDWGLAISNQGNHEKAEKILSEVYFARKKSLGIMHGETLISLSNLANIALLQNNYSKAETLQRQYWKGREKKKGPNHVDTLKSLHNLALTYTYQGKYRESENLNDLCAKSMIQKFGKKHSFTLKALNYLALDMVNQGQYQRPQRILNNCWTNAKTYLGATHPVTLMIVDSLAFTFLSLGKYAHALEIYNFCFDARRRTMGQKDRTTLATLNKLAYTLYKQGNYNESEKLQEQCWETQKNMLGETHRDTLSTLNDLALVISEQGCYSKAEELQRQSFEATKDTLGISSPTTLNSMNNLAYILCKQQKYIKAKNLYHQCFGARQKLFGKRNPYTLRTMNGLAYSISNQGWYKKGEKLQRECWRLTRKLLGETHPDTLDSMNNLAFVVSQLGRFVEAHDLYKECYESCCQVLGETHPLTRDAKNGAELFEI